jgi:hypothetical protein
MCQAQGESSLHGRARAKLRMVHSKMGAEDRVLAQLSAGSGRIRSAYGKATLAASRRID